MTLKLSIENFDRLPDGGPLRVEARSRGLDVGRDAHLDWTLPDPSRHVSGKHCEIRYRDGGYWLHDVSTNGTFLNDSQFRLSEPYLLKDGDRLTIGPYIVAVEVTGAPGAAARPSAPPARGEDLWGGVGETAAPEDKRAYRNETAARRAPDFLDYAASVRPEDPMAGAFAPPRPDADAWMAAPADFAPSREPVAAPTPRRPPQAAQTAHPEPVPATERANPQPVPIAQGDADALLARLAAAAGIPPRALVGRDPNAVVDDIGAVLRLTIENLALMLAARAEGKSLMRSSSRTMIRARENNPLKFSASREDALAVMFGQPSTAYLDARAAISESFADIKKHQVLTGLATQAAIEELFAELAPASIDKSVESERGLGALLASRKARMWDVFVERWRAKTKRSDGRLTEAFAAAFAEAYDRLNDKKL